MDLDPQTPLLILTRIILNNIYCSKLASQENMQEPCEELLADNFFANIPTDELVREISNLIQSLQNKEFKGWFNKGWQLLLAGKLEFNTIPSIGEKFIINNLFAIIKQKWGIEVVSALLAETFQIFEEMSPRGQPTAKIHDSPFMMSQELEDRATAEELEERVATELALDLEDALDFDAGVLKIDMSFQWEVDIIVAVIQALPKSIINFLVHLDIVSKTTPKELLQILNSFPPSISYVSLYEVDLSKMQIADLQQVFRNLNWGDRVLRLSIEDLPVKSAPEVDDLLSILPPRVRIKKANRYIKLDVIQIEARNWLHAALSQIEDAQQNFSNSVLTSLLQDTNFWRKLLAEKGRDSVKISRILLELNVAALQAKVQDKLACGNLNFAHIRIFATKQNRKDLNSPDYFEIIMRALEAKQTPLAHFCCALLLAKQIPCFYDYDKTLSDAREYLIKRSADAVRFLYLAAQNPALKQHCYHLLSQLKDNIMLTNSRDDKLTALLQYISRIANKLEIKPLLFSIHDLHSKAPLYMALGNPFAEVIRSSRRYGELSYG